MCRPDPVRNARQRTLKTQNPKLKTQNLRLFVVFAWVTLGCLSRAAFAQYSVQLDLTEQKAYLLYHERSVMESPICSGRPGHLTPTGTFHITNKDLNHVSSIYGRIVDHWKRTVVADADVECPHRPARGLSMLRCATYGVRTWNRLACRISPRLSRVPRMRSNAGTKRHCFLPGRLCWHPGDRVWIHTAQPPVPGQ